MSAVEITVKMKKIGAVLLLYIVCAACPVHADQQFVLTVGDTMVIPCLIEIWSDQSVSCVISNPEVLMSDGSGRAVIAISEGTSDVYVHMTNPDTDIRYTFVVEPAQFRETEEEWTLPEETTVGGTTAGDGHTADDDAEANGGNHISGDAESNGGNHISGDAEVNGRSGDGGETEGSGGTPAGDEGRPSAGEGAAAQGVASPGGSADLQTEAHMPEEERDDSKSDHNMPEEERDDSKPDHNMPEEGLDDSEHDLHLPEEEERAAPQTAESIPFWEDRGGGGITFRLIEDGFFGKAEAVKGDSGGRNTKYRPFAYLDSDGEVVPLFVCEEGREVRWKYVGRILYIEVSSAYTGPYRVCACDSMKNIYYFSS